MTISDSVDNWFLTPARIVGGQERVESEVRKVAARLASLEASTAAGRRDSHNDYGQFTRQQSSIDQIKARVDRIDIRLEIAG
ncbi:MAG: hypothetical protein V5B34_18410 [Accumulibacter sp.]